MMKSQLTGKMKNGKTIHRYRHGSLQTLMGVSTMNHGQSAAGMCVVVNFGHLQHIRLDSYTASDM